MCQAFAWAGEAILEVSTADFARPGHRRAIRVKEGGTAVKACSGRSMEQQEKERRTAWRLTHLIMSLIFIRSGVSMGAKLQLLHVAEISDIWIDRMPPDRH